RPQRGQRRRDGLTARPGSRGTQRPSRGGAERSAPRAISPPQHRSASMATFVDRVHLQVVVGSGGYGAASIRREKCKPLAGPDGADGGRGGDVILEVDASTTTLLAYHHRPHQRATGGGFGKGDLRHGAGGEDLVLPVPDGTVVTAADGTVLADLVG